MPHDPRIDRADFGQFDRDHLVLFEREVGLEQHAGGRKVMDGDVRLDAAGQHARGFQLHCAARFAAVVEDAPGGIEMGFDNHDMRLLCGAQ